MVGLDHEEIQAQVEPSNNGGRATTSRESTFDEPIVRKAESAVEDFGRGKLTKRDAVIRIIQAFDAQPGDDSNSKSQALAEFIEQIDQIQADTSGASWRGEADPKTKTASMHASRKRNRRHASAEGSARRDEGDESIDDLISKLSREKEGGGGSEESNSSSESSESESTDSTESVGQKSRGVSNSRGRSNKKQRIYESDMPWFSSETKERRRKSRRSCNQTRDILEILQKDPATVKRWIRSSIKSPKEFTEWDSLIKDEGVNLNAVYSALYFLDHPEENIGRVGSTEIHFGKPKPARKIETSGQWTAAWNLTVQATAFLFPHCYDELQAYGQYMERLFSSKSVSAHHKLLKYDEAVRQRVGSGQSLLLTERSEFRDYWEAIVAVDGIGAEQRGAGGSGKGRSRSDICHRFNAVGGCKLEDKCIFRHICKSCKQRGHGKVDCKINERV